MAKNKKGKKTERKPNIPAATLLRPRLDKLLSNNNMIGQEKQKMYMELDRLSQEVKNHVFLPTIISAYVSVPSPLKSWLDYVLPEWLAQKEYIEELELMVQEQKLNPEQQGIALEWLQNLGRDVAILDIPTAEDLFYKAYYHGNQFQGTIILLWYISPKRSMIQGANYLLDYNPPWNGAVKDGFFFPKKTTEKLETEILSRHRNVGMILKDISAAEAKDITINALVANYNAGIRLHRDAALTRDGFEKHILPLTGLPETPDYSLDDFDYICDNGKRAETLQSNEKNFGYRTRTDSGEEVVLFNPDV